MSVKSVGLQRRYRLDASAQPRNRSLTCRYALTNPVPDAEIADDTSLCVSSRRRDRARLAVRSHRDARRRRYEALDLRGVRVMVIVHTRIDTGTVRLRSFVLVLLAVEFVRDFRVGLLTVGAHTVGDRRQHVPCRRDLCRLTL